MGVSYSLSLVAGFELSHEEVLAPFQKSHTTHEDGVFHMEDRFDPKTGVKIEPEKVWDKKPKSHTDNWLEIDNVKYDSNLYGEELCDLLSNKFDCHVEVFGSYPAGELTFVFHVNDPVSYKDANDYGIFTIYNNSIEIDAINKLQPKLILLQSKLEDTGYKLEKPKVFIATCAS